MQPDKEGHFGMFGGKFIPETLMPAVEELETAYGKAACDSGFQDELSDYLREYAGRPTGLYFADELTRKAG